MSFRCRPRCGPRLLLAAVIALSGLVPLAVPAAGQDSPAGPTVYADEVSNDRASHHYPLDETEGDAAADLGSAREDGTWSSAGVQRGVPGVVTGRPAAAFDGTTGAVTAELQWVPEVVPNSFSIEFWAKRTATPGDRPGLLRLDGHDGAAGWEVWYDDQARLHLTSSGVDVATPADAFSSSGFRHFVVTYDGAVTRWYVDGALVTEQQSAFRHESGSATLTLGRGTDPGAAVLDEVSIYDHALTALRIDVHAASAGECRGPRSPHSGVSPVPGIQDDVATSPDGRTTYAPSLTGWRVHQVDVATGAAGCPLDVGGPAGGLDTDVDGEHLYVAAGGHVVEIDTATWSIARRFPVAGVAGERALDVAVTADGRALVPTTDNRMVELELATGAVRTLDALSGNERLYMPRVESSLDKNVVAFVSTGNSEGAVAVLDVLESTLTRKNTGRYLRDISVDATGDRLIAASFTGALLLDRTLRLRGTVSSASDGAAVSPQGDLVWSVGREGQALAASWSRAGRLDGSVLPLSGTYGWAGNGSRGPVGSSVVTQQGDLVTVDDDGLVLSRTADASARSDPPTCPVALDEGGFAELAEPGSALALEDDARTAWIALPRQNAIVPVDLVGRSVGCPVPVGSLPRALAVSEDGAFVHVGNGGAEDVSVVDVERRVEVDRPRVEALAGDTPLQVAGGPAGSVLVKTANSDGHAGRLVQLTPSGVLTTLPGGANLLAGTADRRQALSVETNIDHATTVMYDLVEGTQRHVGKVWGFVRRIATGGTGSVSLVGSRYYADGWVTVLDAELDEVSVVSDLVAEGLTLSADGRQAWVVQAGQALELDLSDPAHPVRGRTVPLPDLSGLGRVGAGLSAASSDGGLLVVLTDTGVAVVGSAPPAESCDSGGEGSPDRDGDGVADACDDIADVPTSHPLHPFVSTLLANEVTSGCQAAPLLYCPTMPVSRQQMATLVLKAGGLRAADLPPYDGEFADVGGQSPFAPWIAEFARQGITVGCGTDTASGKPVYCPSGHVTREHMAVFLLKAAGVTKDDLLPYEGAFADVPSTNRYALWIEELARRKVTVGIGNSNYGPTHVVSRGQMAAFLVKNFELT